MRKSLLVTTVALTALLAGGTAQANDGLIKDIENSSNWAIQTGDYANQRYSKLDQINKDNVKDLKVAWTFSTGVLRGHEGSPLVIGDMMYVHTPFPNNVYALDLANDGALIQGQSTQPLARIELELEGNAIFAVGVSGYLFGFEVEGATS